MVAGGRQEPPGPPSPPPPLPFPHVARITAALCLIHQASRMSHWELSWPLRPAKCCKHNKAGLFQALKSISSAPPALWVWVGAKYNPGCFPLIKCELRPSLCGLQTLLMQAAPKRLHPILSEPSSSSLSKLGRKCFLGKCGGSSVWVDEGIFLHLPLRCIRAGVHLLGR